MKVNRGGQTGAAAPQNKKHNLVFPLPIYLTQDFVSQSPGMKQHQSFITDCTPYAEKTNGQR